MTHSTQAHDHHVCLACGYTYQQTNDVRFDDLASDWRCPLCGVNKSNFERRGGAVDNALGIRIDRRQDPTKTDAQAGVVIIGAGLAGWSVVDALRALDTALAITLISADAADRYHKPMLSAAISQGKSASDLVRKTGKDAANEAAIRLMAHTTVTSIDPMDKCVHTEHGKVPYGQLVLAIGATPNYPPTIDKTLTQHVNHIQDFAKFHARLSQGSDAKHIAVIGAGMIGTEMAEDLIKAGHQVSLIDTAAYPLSAMLPDIAGERILNALKHMGVAWHGERVVTSIHLDTPISDDPHTQYHVFVGEPQGATTEQITCDDVLIATGLGVPDALPMSAGIDIDKRTGILVDPTTLQTSVPDIYALGDCISIDGIPCRYVAPHRAQASAIAGQILKQSTLYQHKTPMIRLKNKSISVIATGTPSAAGTWQVVSDDDEGLVLTMSDSHGRQAQVTIKSA